MSETRNTTDTTDTMRWSSLDTLRQELLRRWERGYFWQAWFVGSELFPWKFRIKGPATKDWATLFTSIQQWAQEYSEIIDESCFSIEWVEVKHRILGMNRVPSHIVFRDLKQLAIFLQRTAELELFTQNAQHLLKAIPTLLSWLKAHSQNALMDSKPWSHCVRVALWILKNPRPGIYLRQIPVPGIDTKFVQAHQGLLQAWLSELNQHSEIADSFSLRLGFLDKPSLLRIRILDPQNYVQGLSDLTLRVDEFAHWVNNIKIWIVVENDITALAMPFIPSAAVIFGRGYGFEPLQKVTWLARVNLFYWGDLDSHGFAILSQFRAAFPQAKSLLMDRETLLQHQEQWVYESTPTNIYLANLTQAEHTLYEDLVSNAWGANIRLEQERIDFGWIERVLLQVKESRV